MITASDGTVFSYDQAARQIALTGRALLNTQAAANAFRDMHAERIPAVGWETVNHPVFGWAVIQK